VLEKDRLFAFGSDHAADPQPSASVSMSAFSSIFLDAIEERLREDLGDEREELLALNVKADPLLAALWDDRKDAVYDRLRRSHRIWTTPTHASSKTRTARAIEERTGAA